MSPPFRRILLTVLALYAAWRLAVLADGMTHVDDIGPLTAILRWPQLGLHGLWRQLRVWTYAPAPYLLAGPGVCLASSAKGALWAARAVSLAGWGLGLGLFWGLLRAMEGVFPGRWSRALSVGLCFWALASWRGFIESGLAYNYAWALAAAVLFLRYYLSRLALPPLGGSPVRGLGPGLLLGAGAFFTYQTVFIGAAVFAALFTVRLFGKDREAWREEAFSALGFGACVMLAWSLHLRYLPSLPGHPPWAAGYPHPQNGFGKALGELALGAWGAWQNVLAVAPWGPWTQGIGASAALAGLAGLAWGWHALPKRGLRLSLLLLGISLLGVWSLGAWTQRFPLGPTRHTFVLQAPALLLLGLGLQGLPRSWIKVGSAALALVWLTWMPHLYAGTRGHVDLARIEALLDQDPAAVAVEAPLSYTKDHMLLWNARPDLRPRLQDGELGLLLAGPQAPAALILASHRGPLAPEALAVLAKAGYVLQPLAAEAPTGSLELVGDLNGGNGFYLYSARRTPPPKAL